MQDVNSNITVKQPKLPPNFRYMILTKECHACGGIMYPFDHYTLSKHFFGHVCVDCGRLIYDKEELKHVC